MATTLQYWGTVNYQEFPLTGRLVLWTPKQKQDVPDAIATTLLAAGVGFLRDNDDRGEVAVYATDSSGNVVGLVGPGGTTIGLDGKSTQYTLGPVAPTTDVTLSDSGVAGNPNGQYWGKVTFVTAQGETDYLTTIPTSVTVASKQITWSNIPVSSDATVTARKLYRTVAGSDNPADPRQYFLVATINDNTTTTYTDNVADGSLGAHISGRSTARGLTYSGSTIVASSVGISLGIGAGVFSAGSAAYANISIGTNSMSANLSGIRNLALGVFALTANTTGSRNVAIGTHALNSSTTGSDSVAVGYGALFTQTTAATNPNTAVGAQALYTVNNASGSNVGIGYQAGQLMTTGNGNTYVGFSAGRANTGAINNVLVGNLAGYNSTNGSFNFNVAVGTTALQGAGVQSSNVAIGYAAFGGGSYAGGSGIAIGMQAGKYETASNSFYVNNQDRTNTSGDKTLSLMYGTFAAAAANQQLTVNGVFKPLYTTVASLPSAATVGAGFKAMVSDALAPAFLSAVAGGGAVVCPVFSNGTSWIVG